MIVRNGEEGAWYKLERGEFTFPQFIEAFNKECSKEVKYQFYINYPWFINLCQ
jgi:hypothetical protein